MGTTFYEGQEVIALRDIDNENVKAGDHLIIKKRVPNTGYYYCINKSKEEVCLHNSSLKTAEAKTLSLDEELQNITTQIINQKEREEICRRGLLIGSILRVSAVFIFSISIGLAVYFGIINAKELVPGDSGLKERFNFLLFFITFLKCSAYGLFTSVIVLALGHFVDIKSMK